MFCTYIKQHEHFVEYLEAIHHKSTKVIKRLHGVRLGIRWRTKNNNVDCGIFVMRHLETYIGGGVPNFKSGFVTESVSQLMIQFLVR